MKNIAILDIDGCLADYRLGLLWWINTNYLELRETCYEHLTKTGTWINNETMKIPFIEWLGILENFRMSGGKLSIPTFPGTRELFDLLLSRNMKIILVTSRPIDLCSNIYHDTVEWLRMNRLEYHMLLWSKNKSEMIYKMRLIDECDFVLDDELGHIKGYLDLGIKTYWINHYHKIHSLTSEHLYEVYSLKQVIEAERSLK